MCFSLQRRAIFPHRNFKKWSETVSFYDFDLKMCFSPQRRAIFQHRNFQKWSEPVARGAFLLKMCFSPQRRAIFQHRNFQKWSEPVARGAFLLKMCFSPQRRAIFHVFSEQPPPHPCFSEVTFRLQPTHKTLQNTAFRDFSNISRLLIFFLSAPVDLLSCSTAFSTVHIVGS